MLASKAVNAKESISVEQGRVRNAGQGPRLHRQQCVLGPGALGHIA